MEKKKMLLKAYVGYLRHNLYEVASDESPIYEKIGYYKNINYALGVLKRLERTYNRNIKNECEKIHIISVTVID